VESAATANAGVHAHILLFSYLWTRRFLADPAENRSFLFGFQALQSVIFRTIIIITGLTDALRRTNLSL
jgi:hypothetical protein